MEHIEIYRNDEKQSITKITIDETEVYVGWWWSTSQVVTEDELIDFLKMKAYIQINRYDLAKQMLIDNGASGNVVAIEREQDGLVWTEIIDTRNQRQKWFDVI
jgi:hypothetical protein